MTLTTITISAEDELKRRAQQLLKKQGVTLENALHMYLKNLVLFEGDMPVLLHEVADKDIPAGHQDILSKIDGISEDEFIIH